MNNKDFSDWLIQYENLFYQEARRFFSDWDDVQEAVQRAEIKLWELECIRATPAHNLGGRARVVTRFTCLNILKTAHSRGEISYDQHSIPLPPAPPAPVTQCDLSDVDWFADLSLEDQALARLLYQNRSQRNIASMLGVPHRRVSYSIERLRRRLSDVQSSHYRTLSPRQEYSG